MCDHMHCHFNTDTWSWWESFRLCIAWNQQGVMACGDWMIFSFCHLYGELASWWVRGVDYMYIAIYLITNPTVHSSYFTLLLIPHHSLHLSHITHPTIHSHPTLHTILTHHHNALYTHPHSVREVHLGTTSSQVTYPTMRSHILMTNHFQLIYNVLTMYT